MRLVFLKIAELNLDIVATLLEVGSRSCTVSLHGGTSWILSSLVGHDGACDRGVLIQSTLES